MTSALAWTTFNKSLLSYLTSLKPSTKFHTDAYSRNFTTMECAATHLHESRTSSVAAPNKSLSKACPQQQPQSLPGSPRAQFLARSCSWPTSTTFLNVCLHLATSLQMTLYYTESSIHNRTQRSSKKTLTSCRIGKRSGSWSSMPTSVKSYESPTSVRTMKPPLPSTAIP